MSEIDALEAARQAAAGAKKRVDAAWKQQAYPGELKDLMDAYCAAVNHLYALYAKLFPGGGVA